MSNIKNNKTEEESLPGCLVTIFLGFIILMIIISFFEGKHTGKPSAWTSAVVWLYIVFVIWALSRTKFKKVK